MRIPGFVVFLIILVVLIVCGVFCVYRINMFYDHSYTAVFLDNDQVYFGHIVSADTNKMVLSNVYYLRASILKQATNSAEVTLLKRGDELHSPQDPLVLNWHHILFYERMKDDGIVMKAISEHEKK